MAQRDPAHRTHTMRLSRSRAHGAYRPTSTSEQANPYEKEIAAVDSLKPGDVMVAIDQRLRAHLPLGRTPLVLFHPLSRCQPRQH